LSRFGDVPAAALQVEEDSRGRFAPVEKKPRRCVRRTVVASLFAWRWARRAGPGAGDGPCYAAWRVTPYTSTDAAAVQDAVDAAAPGDTSGGRLLPGRDAGTGPGPERHRRHQQDTHVQGGYNRHQRLGWVRSDLYPTTLDAGHAGIVVYAPIRMTGLPWPT